MFSFIHIFIRTIYFHTASMETNATAPNSTLISTSTSTEQLIVLGTYVCAGISITSILLTLLSYVGYRSVIGRFCESLIFIGRFVGITWFRDHRLLLFGLFDLLWTVARDCNESHMSVFLLFYIVFCAM